MDGERPKRLGPVVSVTTICEGCAHFETYSERGWRHLKYRCSKVAGLVVNENQETPTECPYLVDNVLAAIHDIVTNRG